MEQGYGQDSIPTPDTVDKSRVLNVKPLRTLHPVFPSTPPNFSSTSEGGSPFVCVGSSGPFPPGTSPFYPFFTSLDSQRYGKTSGGISPGFNTPISNAVAINSFGAQARSEARKGATPSENGGASSSRRTIKSCGLTQSGFTDEDGYDNGMQETEDMPRSERLRSKFQKRTRGRQEPGLASPKYDAEAVVNDALAMINPAVFDLFRQDEGGKEVVGCTLMIYEFLRKRISQIEETKEDVPGVIRRPDLKAGASMMTRGIRANMKKRIGTVPGVDIGDIFFLRFELCLVGLHSPSMAGIDYLSVKINVEDEPLAVSIVSSGGYDDSVEDPDVLIYSGQGGANRKDKEGKDQKLERGNLALEKSMHRGNDVRVIRGIKDIVNPTLKTYVYDGIYKIQDLWVEKANSGYNVFKYKLVRLPGQPEAFMTWKSIKQWRETPSSRRGVILPDLTSGAENLPVCLVNDVDNEKGPAYFTYVPCLKYSKTENTGEPSNGCTCLGGCQPNRFNCACIQKNEGYLPYTANGGLTNLKSLIYECGPSCQCPPNCRNRVSQGGLKLRLEVFRTKEKGWGLRSLDPIRGGTFISEYAGEVIDNDKIEELGGKNEDDYVFNSTRTYPQLEIFLDDFERVKPPFPLLINAKDVGNVTRFMNHSCSPNVFWRPLQRENKSAPDRHVAFYALRHIPPMVELTYDYGIVPPLEARLKKKKCLCGSLKCKGFFY